MVWQHRGPRRLRTRGSARLRIARRTTWTVLVGSLLWFAVLIGSPMDDELRLLRELILYNLVHLAAACQARPNQQGNSRRSGKLDRNLRTQRP